MLKIQRRGASPHRIIPVGLPVAIPHPFENKKDYLRRDNAARNFSFRQQIVLPQQRGKMRHIRGSTLPFHFILMHQRLNYLRFGGGL